MSPRARSAKAGGGLDEYRAKRDFSKTAEPRGENRRKSGFGYLIQKHAATRLHYDFRLELDGVLKSWAVTRGPSLDPADKRLAVHVEDHPIDYGDFEGLIPKGQYGGGTVVLWDRGEWEPLDDPHWMMDKGHLSFLLHGEKLKGRWELVRIRNRKERERGDNWLLIKSKDEEARAGQAEKFLEQNHRSVKSGLSMDEIAKGKTGAVWQSKPKSSSKARPAWVGSESSDGTPVAGGRPAVTAVSKKTQARRRPLSLAKVKGKRDALPDFVEPQKASRVDRPPEGSAWIHEIKLDGYRAEARLDGKEVQILTRSGLDWTHRFGSVADAVLSLPAKQALIDGEIVAMSNRGVPDFGTLQQALSEERDDRLVYFVFDLLHVDGMDLRGLPQIERKALLEKLVSGAPSAIRYSEHFEGSGDAVYQQASQMRLEGVVSKRADAPYRSGRGSSWVKSKCRERQEFVIGGFSEPTRAGPGIGSLLLGQWDKKKLVYSGRVGTGFSNRVSDELRRKLEKLEQASNPFDAGTVDRRGRIHFVEPKLVCEVELAGWTTDGLVRQASFLGLREDKPARSVKKEVAESVSKTTAETGRAAKTKPGLALVPKDGAKSGRPAMSDLKGTAQRNAGRATSGGAKQTGPGERKTPRESSEKVRESAPALPATRSGGARHGTDTIEGIRLTHPTRVLYPDVGVTKAELAQYYIDVADRILPHVQNRPLAVVRCPDGVNKQQFYQKHLAAGMPDAIESLRVKEKDGKREEHIAIRDVSGLVALVQFSVLEIHPWGVPADDIEHADRIIFDLDPDPSVDWKRVVSAAQEVRERLATIKLKSLLKTTGGKGLHVVVPLNPPVAWPVAKAFCQAFAMHLAGEEPDKYIAKASKAARKGLIFVDYLRNQRGSTAIAPYSTRARPDATVSVPIEWEELTPRLRSDQFTVRNLSRRLAKLKRDPWADFFRIRQTIDSRLFD